MRYWTYDRCQKESLKYHSKKEFRSKCYSAYCIANREHWLDMICGHMIQSRNPAGYWSKDRCRKDALKYKTKKDYKKTLPLSYQAAKRNKWLTEICSHMIKLGNRYNKCVYAYEFLDNSVYVGLTYNIENRQVRRDLNPNDQVTMHINKTGLTPIRKMLTDYIGVDDAIDLERFYVSKYRREGWRILNIAETGSIGGNVVVWTYEKCKAAASKYNTRRSFKIAYPGAFNACHRNGWIDAICSHMKMVYKPKGYWTYENCKKEAKKYKSGWYLKLNCQHVWNVARKNGWLGDFYNKNVKRGRK